MLRRGPRGRARAHQRRVPRRCSIIRVTPNPARVVFSVEPFLDVSDPHTGLELRHDSAYWVSGVEVRGETSARGDKGTVDMTSLGAGRPGRSPAAVRDRLGNTDGGRDFMGPNPRNGFDEWVEQGCSSPAPRSRSRTGSKPRSPASRRSPSTSQRMSLDPASGAHARRHRRRPHRDHPARFVVREGRRHVDGRDARAHRQRPHDRP